MDGSSTVAPLAVGVALFEDRFQFLSNLAELHTPALFVTNWKPLYSSDGSPSPSNVWSGIESSHSPSWSG